MSLLHRARRPPMSMSALCGVGRGITAHMVVVAALKQILPTHEE